LSATPGATQTLGPALGEHTDQILQSLGVTTEQIADLRVAAII
jgi:formyl-CoA transferase